MHGIQHVAWCKAFSKCSLLALSMDKSITCIFSFIPCCTHIMWTFSLTKRWKKTWDLRKLSSKSDSKQQSGPTQSSNRAGCSVQRVKTLWNPFNPYSSGCAQAPTQLLAPASYQSPRGRQQVTAPALGSLPHTWERQTDFWLLVLEWVSSSGYCEHLGSKNSRQKSAPLCLSFR